MEVWKDIKGYEWLYQVSNIWNIRTLKLKEKKVLKQRPLKKWNKYHCPIIDLRIWCNHKKTFIVSRIVAQAFLWLDMNNKKLLVCHKDDNPQNNNIENLFLWSQKDNMQDCSLKWRAWNQWKFWKYHHSSKQVNQYTKDWKFIKTWDSQKCVERGLWILSKRVSDVCMWKLKTAWWYKWSYA